MGVRVGWLEAGDVTTADWADGITLTLDGVPDASHSDDADRNAWAQAAVCSVRAMPGLIVPVVSDDVPMIDGLYRVETAATTSTPLMVVAGVIQPPSLTLRFLAAGSARGETSVTAAMRAVVPPVELTDFAPRWGVPGARSGSTTIEDTLDLAEGRCLVLNAAVDDQGQAWAAWDCKPSEFLAGSPRVQIQAAGQWWTIHGQPPPGVPVRIHNGRIGLELPHSTSFDLGLLTLDASGAVTSTTTMNTSDTDGLVGHWPSEGIEVVRADPEMVWVRWSQPRLNLFAVRQGSALRGEAILTRGSRGLALAFGLQVRLDIAAAKGTDITDDASTPNTIGCATDASGADWRVMAHRTVTTSAPTGVTTRIDKSEFWRIEKGSNSRTRRWVAPMVSVLR